MADGKALLEWAQRDPVGWLDRTFAPGFWERQAEIVRSFFSRPETYVPSCHASGKSYTAAHATLAAVYTHPWSKTITTATAWHQVESVLWAELRQAWERAKLRAERGSGLPLGGPEPNLTALELGPGWFAVGLSTDNPVRMQGQHARGGVYMIVDEADGIPDEIWEAVRANLSTGDCHLLAIGNPVDPQSYFARQCADPSKAVLPIDAFATPNFTAFGLTLDDFKNNTWEEKVAGAALPSPWLITPQWVAQALADERGDINSPFFLSRVRAMYPDMSDDALIKQAWIERAWNNWKDGKSASGRRGWGLDVARFGSDKTVLTAKVGGKYWVVEQAQGLDGPQVAELARRNWHRDRLERNDDRTKPPIGIDVIGVGASAYDDLRKEGFIPCVPVESAGAPDCECKGAKEDGRHEANCPKTRYLNRRAQLWWEFREELRAGNIALDPSDRKLARQLTAMKFQINKGRIQIEEKAEIKARIGESPDRADAIVYASATTNHRTVEFLEAMSGL